MVPPQNVFREAAAVRSLARHLTAVGRYGAGLFWQDQGLWRGRYLDGRCRSGLSEVARFCAVLPTTAAF
jgi:hypothetical protein